MSESVKVSIDTPGPTVVVEASEPLDVVAAKALEIYKTLAPDWPQRSIGAGTGFVVERSGD